MGILKHEPPVPHLIGRFLLSKRNFSDRRDKIVDKSGLAIV